MWSIPLVGLWCVSITGGPEETPEQVLYQHELEEADIDSMGTYARMAPGEFVALELPYGGDVWSPSTDLADAMDLWERYPPGPMRLTITCQCANGVDVRDLPRLITEATRGL
jgi:hypothetical protein